MTAVDPTRKDGSAGGSTAADESGLGSTALAPRRLLETSTHAVHVAIPAERSATVRYGAAIVAVALALLLTLAARDYLQNAILLLFWPVVIGAAWFGGVGPAVLASALSIIAADWFFIGPARTLDVGSSDDLFPLVLFLFASITVALLVSTARASQRLAARAASQNAELAQELELQAVELEQQLEESQSLSEELEQSTEELAERTAAAEAAELYATGILDSIAHPFVVHDASWRFRYINEPAAAVFRRSPRAGHEPPLGHVVWDLYPDLAGTVFEREMRLAAESREPRTFEAFYPGRGEWIAISCFPLSDGGLATQWTDVTARKRAEETEHYLSRATELLSTSLDYETTLDAVARLVVPTLADWCAVSVVEPSGELRQVAVAHVDPAKVALARELNMRYPPRLDAATGAPHVLRTGRPELLAEITDDMLTAGAVDAEHLRIVRQLGLRSAVTVPLVAGGRPLGVLTLVAAESGRRYSEGDLPLAAELARRAAIAVDHARLHRETLAAQVTAEHAARIASRLHALTSRLAGSDTPRAVAEVVLEEAMTVFGAERATMSLIDDGGDTVRQVAAVGYEADALREWHQYSLRDTGSLTRTAATTGRGVFVPTFDDVRTRFPALVERFAAIGNRSAAVLPIVRDGRTRAVITLAWTADRALPDGDRELMETFAAQCGQALQRAVAFDAERSARERVERLQRITAALAAASSEQEVARVVVANLRELLSPRAVAIYRVDGGDGDGALVMMNELGVETDRRERYARISLGSDLPLADVVRSREPVFLANDTAFRTRYPAWRADGRAPDEEAWAALPLTASTGRPLGVIALAFDEQRHFDEDMRRYIASIGDQATQGFERVRLLAAEHDAREAAEEANRAKTQFLATMSHELRTPLNAISGYAELLSLGLRGPTTPEQQEDLARIMRSQRHLLSVINDILNFARLDAGQIEYHIAEVPVADLVGDLESLIRPQLTAKELDFACEQVRRDLVACADREKVRQVLLNLLANAVKFTRPGGRVRVECEHDVSHVYVRVTDTGIGIPADRQASIFEPFVQLHRTLAQPAEGTGLGLAISRDLARGMGGDLSVTSEPGRGSTFTLTLERAS